MPTTAPNMAEPVADLTALQRALEWSKVTDVPAGKERFRAVRSMLKDYLQTSARAPNAAKKFLSEDLITSVGPTGAASKLPRELRQILGSAADDFAGEVQTGYFFLTGKAPGGPTNAAFKNILSAMGDAGMPAEHIATLRKIGPAGLIKMGGPGRAVAALTEAQKDPGILNVINWASRKVTGAAKEVRPQIPVPLAEAAKSFKPAAETYATLGEAGVTGLGKVARGVRAAGVLAPLGVAYSAYEAASTVGEVGEERERAESMAKTGIIPDVMGGPAVVARTAKGEPITSGQFLQMMQEREDQMKMARFNAMTQEGDLTNRVMSYISGGGEQDQRAVQRMQLGSARPAQMAPQPVDQVMKQFDSFLRQATAAQGTPEGG